MTAVYYDNSLSLQRNFFAPSMPRRARYSPRLHEEVGLCSSLPQTNFLGFASRRPESTQAVRPSSNSSAMGGWLKERARWKSMQKTGLEGLCSPPAVSTPDPVHIGFSSPSLNLVELSLAAEEPVTGVKRDFSPGSTKGKISPFLENTQPELELSYGYLRPKSQKFTKFLRKQPVSVQREMLDSRLSSFSRTERIYPDSNIKKILARVVVPAPAPISSIGSSRQGTAHSTSRPKPMLRATITPKPPSPRKGSDTPWGRSRTLQTKVLRTRHFLQPRSSPHSLHETARSPLFPLHDARPLPPACESPAHSSRNPTPILESRYH